MTLREKHGYCEFKEERLGGKQWRTGFNIRYRPVAGKTKIGCIFPLHNFLLQVKVKIKVKHPITGLDRP
jgi:hypothetical protein